VLFLNIISSDSGFLLGTLRWNRFPIEAGRVFCGFEKFFCQKLNFLLAKNVLLLVNTNLAAGGNIATRASAYL